jgi:hypothetical protein
MLSDRMCSSQLPGRVSDGGFEQRIVSCISKVSSQKNSVHGFLCSTCTNALIRIRIKIKINPQKYWVHGFLYSKCTLGH